MSSLDVSLEIFLPNELVYIITTYLPYFEHLKVTDLKVNILDHLSANLYDDKLYLYLDGSLLEANNYSEYGSKSDGSKSDGVSSDGGQIQNIYQFGHLFLNFNFDNRSITEETNGDMILYWSFHNNTEVNLKVEDSRTTENLKLFY